MLKSKETKSKPSNLGRPKSNRQMFTVAENKLLDQITLEIMEAWAKDLNVMKKYYSKLDENYTIICDYSDLFKKMYKEFNEFLEDINKFQNLTKIIENQFEIFSFLEEIRKSLFELEKKSNYSYVKDINKDLKTLIESLKPDVRKKWWEFWK